MLLDIWTFLWLLVCLTILISILNWLQESVYRRIKERQVRQQELELQRQIQAQQYHVYTLQPLSTPLQNTSTTTISSVLSQQQQEYIHEQQELKASNDLPPKYEDVVKTIPYTGIPLGYVLPSSSQPQAPPPLTQRSIDLSSISDSTTTAQTQRY